MPCFWQQNLSDALWRGGCLSKVLILFRRPRVLIVLVGIIGCVCCNTRDSYTRPSASHCFWEELEGGQGGEKEARSQQKLLFPASTILPACIRPCSSAATLILLLLLLDFGLGGRRLPPFGCVSPPSTSLVSPARLLLPTNSD